MRLRVHPFMSAFVSRHLSPSEGCFDLCTSPCARVSVPPPVSVCLGPVAASPGPQDRGGVIFHSDRQWPTQGGPQVSSLIASGRCSSSSPPTTSDRGPCRSRGREMASTATLPVCYRMKRNILPVVPGKGSRQRQGC